MRKATFPKIKLEGWQSKIKKKNFLKVILILLLFLFILFGIFKFKEVFEGYLNWQYFSKIYEKMLAQIPVDYSFLKPFRNWRVKDLQIGAVSVISVGVDNLGNEYILFSKNPDKILPIASLSKILSGFFVVENYNLNRIVKFSKKAIETEGEIGFFREGERFYVKDLLHSVMLESSNDATVALAEVVGVKKFVKMMQKKAKEIGLKNTYFVNPTGVDPDFPGEKYNYSTARDLAKLAKFILQKSKTDPRADFLIKMTQKKEFYLYRADNSFHHKIKNTNKLLEKYQKEIIFGKTGYTLLAGECLLLVIKHPKEKDGFIINVILNSKNRFEDMEKLINWVKEAYIW
ncbi:MAG: serine hydrolase [Candidatus Pacebacteria bacterium]|nr:serine hydrolase [Candidatus Paceibacterota bacterium]